MNESSCCSIPSLAFGIVRIPDFDHCNRYIVVSHCYFNLFPDDTLWSILYDYLPSVYLWLGVSVQVFCTFFNWVSMLRFKCVCIFWITVFYQLMSLRIFFLHFFFDSVFCRAEVLNFNEVQHINFFSWILPLVLYLESPHHTQVHLDFPVL